MSHLPLLCSRLTLILGVGAKPAPCSANGKPLRPDPEGAPAKESNSTFSQLDFVIRKHGGKKSLTLFAKTDPEDKTNTFEFDVMDLSLLNCKGPSWICWDTFETKKTNTNKQFADCLTESLKAEKFAKTQQMLCGWHCLTESLTLCETSLHFIVTSFKRECCWNVPRCPISFRLECAQFEAHSFSFHV